MQASAARLETRHEIHAGRALDAVRWLERQLDAEVRVVGAVHLLGKNHGQISAACLAGQRRDGGHELQASWCGHRRAGQQEVDLHVNDEER